MSASANRELIERFYHAFQQRDAAIMAACYHANATFRDPVFELRGAHVGAMWKMLCARGAKLRVDFSSIAADDSNGSADWQAWYTFSATGRDVHNIIHAHFRFADGLIVEHVDDFDFWRWSRQALGPAGRLLGWTPLLRNRVRREAARMLDRFVSAQTP
jgi:ketosteroid isomerase-like protein